MRTTTPILFLICTTLCMSLLALSSPAHAGYPKKSKGSPTPAANEPKADRITAVHLTSVTISLAATHQGKEYKVAPATTITVNGQPGTLSSLAVGMDVSVTPAPNDPTTAAVIDAKTRAH